MDKYTKFILSIIAVGIVGINYHLFKGEIITSANAANDKVHKIAICNELGNRCTSIFRDQGFNYLINFTRNDK